MNNEIKKDFLTSSLRDRFTNNLIGFMEDEKKNLIGMRIPEVVTVMISAAVEFCMAVFRIIRSWQGMNNDDYVNLISDCADLLKKRAIDDVENETKETKH